MYKKKSIKLLLSLAYLAILITFLYYLFSIINLEDIKNYTFIQSYHEQLNQLKNKNMIFLFIIFFILTLLWVLLLGFGSPIALVGGFIFGKWIGTLIVTISLSSGALLLYLVGKFFLYKYLQEKFFKKFHYLNLMFQKKELFVMIIFRFVGLVPFFLANLIPVIFNISSKNYFLGTLIGILPSVFIMVSLGSGFSNSLYIFDSYPSFIDLIILPDIYFPIIGFFIVLIISYFTKKIYIKKKHEKNKN